MTVAPPSPTTRRFTVRHVDQLNPVDPQKRARANYDALRTVLQLRTEGRAASNDERAVIARFSGWGALPHLFDDDPDWDKARDALRPVLDELHPEAWTAAAAATLNSHYTDVDVAAHIWGMLRTLGIAGSDGRPLRVYEPGVGSGIFLSTCPRDINADWYAVDIDPTAVAVARALHPDATIDLLGLEQVQAPDDTFDLVIGNVPYGKYKLVDRRHNKHGWTVHNHATYKAICLTRPGGLVALLTSRYLADSRSPKVREALDELADLIAVVRFPNRTFERAAGTSVVEDLLVFRRRPYGALHPAEQALIDDHGVPARPWLETAARYDPDRRINYRVNEALVDLTGEHPAGLPFAVALGRQHTTRGAHGVDDYALTLTPTDGRTVRERAVDLFATAASEIGRRARQAGLVYQPRDDGPGLVDVDWDTRWQEELDQRKEGSIHLTDKGGLVRITGGRAQPHKAPKSRDTAELKALVGLRDATVATLAVMVQGGDPQPCQARLSGLYDDYTATFGFLNRFRESTRIRTSDSGEPEIVVTRTRPTMGGFRADPDFWTVMALELWDDSTRTASKAPIFTMNVVGRPATPNPQTLPDAVAVSLNETAGVDPDLCARLLTVGRDQVEADLRAGRLAFENPTTGHWEHPAVYLSGDVRQKLDDARAARQVDDGRWTVNVAALEAVQPADLGPEDIDLRLGSPMIDVADVEQFAEELLGARPQVTHLAAVATWEVEIGTWNRRSVAATSTWGTSRAGGYKLVDWALNLKPAAVYDKVEGFDGKDRMVLNRDETDAAQAKLDELGDRFADWLWEHPERTQKYVDRYNRQANCWAAPTHDGSHLTLPGLSPAWTMRPHQLDAIWRTITEGGGVLAHSVGLGKTAILVSSAIEMRRLGIAAKPLVVVPNHMLEQISREARLLYPAARMLVCGAEDAAKDGRRQFVAKCATGNWDLVVMTHSAFGLIPLSAQAQARHIAAQIAVLRRCLADAGKKVKQIEQAIKRKEERVRQAIERGKDDAGLTFEETGVDYVMIDEAHLFKNLAVDSSIQGIAGRNSKRAEDLACKIDYLTERFGDFSQRGPNPTPRLRRRRVILSTGTPVANSIAELWVMSRFADYPRLCEAGYSHFDAWFGAFGQTVARLEVSPDGGGFRVKHRPARFRNVPELLALWLQVADVRSLKTVAGIDVPAVVGGSRRIVAVPPSSGHQRVVAELMVRCNDIMGGSPQQRPTTVRQKNVDTGLWETRHTSTEDNLLWVVGDGRKAALHLPLVGENPDPDGGKIRACAVEVARIYHATNGRGYETGRPGSLQLVFCDLGVNPADRCQECGYPQGQGDTSCATCQETSHASGMSVYDVLRVECARLGVPYRKVRFMGEAKTDTAKAALFDQARNGEVAVLVGSTEKMGVGTNVQARCVALHHLDAPWRPCDIEQREGRIVRQGNLNSQVDVLVYVCEGTFDAFMWQTLEVKASFIEQVTSGNVTSRTVDDVGETSMGYAEVKAAAAGNPVILEHAHASLQLKALRARRASHARAEAELASKVWSLTEERSRLLDAARSFKRDEQTIGRHPTLGVTALPPHGQQRLAGDPGEDLAGWLTWWREDRDKGGRHWRFPVRVGRVGPFPVTLQPVGEVRVGPLDVIDDNLPVLVVGTDRPIRLPVGRRDIKYPRNVNWVNMLGDTLERHMEQRGRVADRIAGVEAELAEAKAKAGRPWDGEAELVALVARVDQLDAAMRALTDVQAPDPTRYDHNPPDDIDWAGLEAELASVEVDEAVAELEALDEPPVAVEDDEEEWVDPVSFDEDDDGQLVLFQVPAAPVTSARRRRGR